MPATISSGANCARVIAVVVTHNRLGLLQECTAALRGQTRPLNAILVVNNGSTDGTREWLDGEPYLRTIHQDNRGSSGGQYAGIASAYEQGFDWIFCMDDDVKPASDAWEVASNYLDSHPGPISGIACAGVDLATGKYALGEAVAYHPHVWRTTRRYVRGTEELYASSGAISIYSSHFEGLIVHRSTVAAIGLPNPDYFLNFEDFEYTQRMSSHAPLILLPNCRIFRMLPSVPRPPFLEAKYFEGMLYLPRNWMYWALRSPSHTVLEKMIKLSSPFRVFWWWWRDGCLSRQSFLRTWEQRFWALRRIVTAIWRGAQGRLGKIDF